LSVAPRASGRRGKRPNLETLRRRAEAALRLRTAATRSAQSRAVLQHELDVHDVELNMQNDELQRLNRELERTRDWYRDLYDSAPVGYVTTTRASVIVAANRLCAAMLGLPAKELVGRDLAKFVVLGSREAFQQHRRRVMRGLIGQSCEVSLELADGRIIDVHMESSQEGAGAVRRSGQIKTVLIDVTGPRRLERQILEGQRELARVLRVHTLGEIAPEMSHEVSQPLQSILALAGGCLNGLRGKGPPRKAIVKAIQAIEAQAERAARLLKRMREFARRTTPELKHVDPNAVVREVVDFVSALVRGRGARIELALGDVSHVWLDMTGIQQIILNLVMNALDAVAGLPARRRVIEVISEQTGGEIVIAVADRGRGLPSTGDGAASRLFSAYYSTKPGGLGLGLSISRRIAQTHGGRLEASNRMGGGATFALHLPAVTEKKK